MHSSTKTALLTFGYAGWLLLAGCHQGVARFDGPVQGAPEMPPSRPAEDGRSGDLPYLTDPSAEAAVETRPDPDPRDIERFVELYQWSAPPYRMVRQHVPQKAMPRLHEMLKDRQWASCWPAIAFTIGEGSDDPSSVPALLDYIRRKEQWDSSDESVLYQRVSAKIGVITWLGRIGGQQAVTTLRAAITREGAAELVKEWGTDKHVLSVMGNSPSQVVRLVNEFAAVGLVFTQDLNNLAAVERERHRAPHPARTMVDAAAYQRIIEERGLEVLLAVKGTSEEMDLLMPVFKEHFEKSGMTERR